MRNNSFARRLRAGEVVEVHDGVEDEGVAAHGFTAVDRVIGEKENIALAKVSVYDDGVLGDGPALVKKTGEQEGFGLGEAQDHLGAVLRRDYAGVVAGLVLVDGARLPGLL